MAPIRLCSRCRAIFDGEIKPHGHTNFDHYHDGDAFISMAETASCYFCTWVWRRYRDSVGYDRGQLPVYRTTVQFLAHRGELTHMFLQIHETEKSSRTAAVFRPQRKDSGSLPNAQRSSLETNVDFHQARKWLQNCNSSHPECHGWKKQRTLPTRLVRVGKIKDSQKIMANICHGRDLPATTTYLSLSHCWGRVSFLTTTSKNISQFELQLPVELLSKTIQDALLVTLEMGFTYIWIDSLCIVQDSINDWTHEASRMGEVYRNTSCNISASGVANGEHGFMPSRVFDPTPVVARVKWSTPEDSEARVCPSEYYFRLDNPLRELSRGPLFERAWTFQEQLLATRALHFGTEQLFWECSRTLANEVWPQGWADKEEADRYLAMLDHIWQFRIDQLPEDRVSCLTIWYSIITDYSNRHVTFETDWLPALAGLASEFASVLKDTYVQGLWSKDLHRGILFAQVDFETPASHVPPRNVQHAPKWQDVPSWSWAALHAAVMWLEKEDVKCDRELCELKLVNATGISMLQLSGMVIPLTSNAFSLMIWMADGIGMRQGSEPDHTGLKIHFDLDKWVVPKFEEEWNDLYEDKDGDGRTRHDRKTDALCAALLFAPILFAVESFGNHKAQVKGLVLHKQPGLGHGQYRRAGVASMHANLVRERDRSLDYETTMGMVRAYAQPLADPSVHEILEDGRYVITIV
ncbi:heterokaryon incompatibility protein-domain-containing protein [Phaeosphaeria sp. MPI-PUGE-AT-0046c]|nr:heterokaryon incompatibility protein-domain-containing protein [Phaeosphaeria sp. MPI-PUGE-AT-0046c]